MFFVFFLPFIYSFVNGALSDQSLDVLSVSVDGLLMNQALIKASSTCGVNGPEKYCRLVDERNVNEFYYGVGNILCDVCDDKNKTLRHPIEYANSDDDNLWWQSPSMAEGVQYQKVNVTIDLTQVYQIVYIILKMGDSPRPGNWILERSMDGRKYQPWIFFAETPYTCFLFKRQYWANLKMTQEERPSELGDDEVFCTTYYSQPKSLRSGEIIISLINGRSSFMIQNDFTQQSIPQTLINFLSARYIRFRFMKHLTLAADLMTHRGYLEKSVYNRYFYSLRNIEIGGKCICNNHADKCEKAEENGVITSECNCKHNTCGKNCEICCPLFNQLPWKPGAICQECNCNRKADRCIYNQTVSTLQLSMNKLGRMEGGGVCVNCRENTQGINCEKCKKGYYRPWNVAATEMFPCRPCQCTGIGTTGSCISNGEEIESERPGDCRCHPGYTGSQCEKCKLGYRRTSAGACVQCPCSIAGSVSSSSFYRCYSPCNCKVNVDVSSKCHQCKFGFFNLDPKNEEGCQKCFCFGITNRCSSLKGNMHKVHTLKGWKITTLTKEKMMDPKESALDYPYVENVMADNYLNNPLMYYFLAPSSYLGNWITSYGTRLLFVVKIDVDPSYIGSQIDAPDVIVECGNNKRITYSVDPSNQRLQRKVLVSLIPSYWRRFSEGNGVRKSNIGSRSRDISENGNSLILTKEAFMSCIVKVTALMIKAKYYTTQQSVSLLNVTMDQAIPNEAMSSHIPQIEKCDCPSGYSGLSCEKCQLGYRRIDNQLVQGICQPCECNGHSKMCDAATGQCYNCQNNTEGPQCSECKGGHYRGRLISPKVECTRCLCPRTDYQMTNSCMPFGNKYICLDCSKNTAGPFCDRCQEGYYGDPKNKIKCRKCNCNDNQESCDLITGQCNCTYLTMGANCQLCANGYYGSALEKNCSVCQCDKKGSKNQYCDNRSGQCLCRDHFTGLYCDKCVSGRYLQQQANGSYACVPCNCKSPGVDTVGSSCDPLTGKCRCMEGVVDSGNGSNCDVCLPNYYGYPYCKECLCSIHSKDAQCDKISGLCSCGVNVADAQCNWCDKNHYWINKSDCAKCNCGVGSQNSYCRMDTGQCFCAPNVVGRSCDKCKFGYYGLSKFGCKKCQPCKDGKICYNDGSCRCPPNTMGDKCNKCQPNYWNYGAIAGCRACNCSSLGAVSNLCDTNTGQCSCRPGYGGRDCKICKANFYDYPNCKPCSCDYSGTLFDRVSFCNSLTGQCLCKENVMGKTCNQCKPGSFNLDRNYDGGCYNCFCLFRSNKCEQLKNKLMKYGAEKTYYITSTKMPYVSGKDYSTIHLFSNTSKYIDWPLYLHKTIYVDVTKMLPGRDMTMFYRSSLFRIGINCKGEGGCGQMTEDQLQPEVVLQSNGGDIEMIYKINLTNQRQITNESRNFLVDVSESSDMGYWQLTKYFGTQISPPVRVNNRTAMPINMWRDALMLSLLNVTQMKVQLYSDQVKPKEIELVLKFNEVVDASVGIGLPITTVEKCSCDNLTRGDHCEDAIPGFYRNVKGVVNINVVVKIDVNVSTEVSACQCYGHSDRCNTKTGVCIDCKNNTAGPKCDQCKLGYYGNPVNGIVCNKCECPSKQNNYADICTKINNQFLCKCRPGYTGSKCDKCAPKYYGNPTAGIDCQRCNCNTQGSLTDTCNSLGICQCAAGVYGAKCDKCSANFVVKEKKCVSCLEGCTKELFEKMDKVKDKFETLKWKSLPSPKDAIMNKINETMNKYSDKMEVINKFNELKKKISEEMVKRNETYKSITALYDKAKKLANEYVDAKLDLEKKIKEANDSVNVKDVQVKNLELLINNATAILNEIKVLSKNLSDYMNNQSILITVMNQIQTEQNLIKKLSSILKPEKFAKVDLLIQELKRAIKMNKYNRLYVELLNAADIKYKNMLKELQNDKELINNKSIIVEQDLQNVLNKIQTLEEEKSNLTSLLERVTELLNNVSMVNNTGVTLTVPQELKDKVDKQIEEAENKTKKLKKEFKFLHNAEAAKEAYSKIIEDINKVENAIALLTLDVIAIAHLIDPNLIQKWEKDFTANQNRFKNIENELKNYSNIYDSLKAKEDNINATIEDIRNKIPTNMPDLSQLRADIRNTESNILKINSTLEKITFDVNNFSYPKSEKPDDFLNFEKEIADTEDKLKDVIKDTPELKKSISTLRDRIQKLQNDIKMTEINVELVHGATALSTEPIRCSEHCMRQYTTYYLPNSNDFDLRFHLKPLFKNVKALVLFGYDDSTAPIHSFAVVLEKDGSIKFLWQRMDLEIKQLSTEANLPTNYYSYAIIKWNLFARQIYLLKPIGKQIENKKTGIGLAKDIRETIRITPKTKLFLGGFPKGDMLKNIKIDAGLPKKLYNDFKDSPFKGCIYDFWLQGEPLGLPDIEELTDGCSRKSPVDITLKTTENCKVNIYNVKKIKAAKEEWEMLEQNQLRVKRETNVPEYENQFQGEGYIRINMNESNNCKSNLQKPLNIHAAQLTSENKESAHIIAVFANDVKKYGFIVSTTNNEFQIAYWKDESVSSLVKAGKVLPSMMMWNVNGKTIAGFKKELFGLNELCDVNSYWYLGGIPQYEVKLLQKLKEMKINPFFSGGIRLEDYSAFTDIFKKQSTRLVLQRSLKQMETVSMPIYSLWMTDKVNVRITYKKDIKAVIKTGFRMDIDFLNQSVTKDVSLMDFIPPLLPFNLSLIVTPKKMVILKINNVEITKSAINWKYNNIEVILAATHISLSTNGQSSTTAYSMPTMAGPFSVHINPLQTPYYIYNLYLGNRKVSFNEKMISIPKDAYLRKFPVSLMPLPLRVDLNEVTVNPGSTKDRMSVNYPMYSAWFSGTLKTLSQLDSKQIEKYWAPNANNKLSIRVLGVRQSYPQQLISFDLGGYKLMYVMVNAAGQLMIYLNWKNWLATLPLSLIDKKWHELSIVSSNSHLVLYIDEQNFNMTELAIPFGVLKNILIGGGIGQNPNINFKGTTLTIERFTGCLDDLWINNKRINLVGTAVHGSELKQCPRALEFISDGGEILSTYAKTLQPKDLIQLNFQRPLQITGNSLSIKINFKIKYNGYEEGSLLMLGNDDQFCRLSLAKNKVYLHYNDFKKGNHRNESIDFDKQGWVSISLVASHVPSAISICKFTVGEISKSFLLTNSKFTDFRPEVFFGLHPNVIGKEFNSPKSNFVGCISDLRCELDENPIICRFDQSKFIVNGKCSIDKYTYLLRH